MALLGVYLFTGRYFQQPKGIIGETKKSPWGRGSTVILGRMTGKGEQTAVWSAVHNQVLPVELSNCTLHRSIQDKCTSLCWPGYNY